MTVLREYLFQNRKGELVAPQKWAVLKGRAHMDVRFFTGQIIKTSRIRKIHEEYVATRNSKYTLDAPSKEYAEFLEKSSKNVPIITNWSLSGNRKDGYIISGKTKTDGKISKKVLSQDGSCLILDDGKEYFVQWRAMSRKVRNELNRMGAILDLEESSDFEDFAFILCKPILFPEE